MRFTCDDGRDESLFLFAAASMFDGAPCEQYRRKIRLDNEASAEFSIMMADSTAPPSKPPSVSLKGSPNQPSSAKVFQLESLKPRSEH